MDKCDGKEKEYIVVLQSGGELSVTECQSIRLVEHDLAYVNRADDYMLIASEDDYLIKNTLYGHRR